MPMARKQTIKRKATTADKLVGQRLRARRLEMHISQTTLADKLGLSFQQVQKYEKGVNRVGASRLQEIAGILQTDFAYFIGDIINGKVPVPSKLSIFMATRDGLNIAEAMMRLDEPHRHSVIALARTLDNAYGKARA
jgi:transcriptional regulator with XRE-family HTH domain